MSKPTDIRIVDASLQFESVSFRTPLKFGGRLVNNSVLVNVEVSVETRNGQGATGMGSMPLGNVWSWPSTSLTAEQTEAAMKRFAEEVIGLANSYPDHGHPIDITFQLS